MLLSISASGKRPWISTATLNLIDARNNARLNYDYGHEVIPNKKTKQAVCKDRSNWLSALIKSGAWEELKALRAKPQRRYGRLRDRDGHITASDEKACTLADYFETIQWSVKCCTIAPSRPMIGNQWDIDTTRIHMRELSNAVSSLKLGKASGDDDILAEFWKALVDDGENEASSYLILLQPGMEQEDCTTSMARRAYSCYFQKL